jgi:rSAM/selenodomain-associated transferase 1
VLALFAKLPVPGQVKTRLAAETSSQFASDVASAFLLDQLDRLLPQADHLLCSTLLAFDPVDAGVAFARLIGDRCRLVPQSPGDLGQRLAAFLTDQFREGAERVVILGTDSPTLPPGFVDQAFRALEQAEVVLGPAMDGGYYLLGCARCLPPIFDGIAWGGSRVLAETIARLTDPTWRVALLPPWYDVDTLDDWLMLRGHLLAQRRAGIDPGVPRTERLTLCPLP